MTGFYRRDVFFLTLAVAWVGVYVLQAPAGFPLDDSWIHQTYGRNLATIGQWAFLPNQPSAGSTSALYTLLLAVGYALNVPYLWWTHGLGAFALGGAGIIASRWASHALPELRYAPFVAGVSVISTWHLVWASASGMETMLFAMLTAWVMWIVWWNPTVKVGIFFGIVGALTFLARPEGVLLVGLAGLAVLLTYRMVAFRWAMGAGIAFIVTITPYLLLNWQLTGGLLPNTAQAKFQQHAFLLAQPLVWRVWDLFLVVMAGGHMLFVPPVLVLAWRLRAHSKRWIAWLPIAWGGALILLYALRLPASYQHGRYVIPVLPAWVMFGAVGLVLLLQWGRFVMGRRILTRTLALATLLTYGVFLLGIGARAYRDDVTIINEEMVANALWIRDNLPPDALLAVHDIGAVGYFAPRDELIDIAGLISPEVVPIVGNGEALWAMLEARGATHLMGFPDQLPNRTIRDRRLCVAFDSNGTMAIRYGGENMVTYQLAWDGECP